MKKNNIKVKSPQKEKLPGFWQWPVIIGAIAVALITFIVYLPALQNDFVNWDDHLYVYENHDIQSIGFHLLLWIPSVIIWHPLTMFSLAVDYAIWGLNPFGYHLTNVVLHSLNTFLVFILIVLLVSYCNWKSNRMTVITGAVTSLLFGIHPLHVESVTWISERKDVLYATFFLLSLLAYIRYASSLDSKRSKAYALSLIFFVLALLSKPMAVTLPIVLLLLDYYPFKRLIVENGFKITKLVIYEKLPFFLLSLLTAITTILAHGFSGGLLTLEKLPFISRILLGGYAYIFYIIKIILPLNLAPLYPYPNNFFTFEYIGSFLLFLTVTLFAFRSNYLIVSIWLYYLITLLPVVGIFQVGRYAVADRFSYLPSLGPFLFVGVCAGYLVEKYPKKGLVPVISILLILTVLLSCKTIKQIGLWRDAPTFWSYEIRLYPDVSSAYYSRGLAYYKLSNYQMALEDLNKTIEIDPQYMNVYYDRGVVYQDIGNYREAMNDYNKAIEHDPQFAKAYNNRGNIFLQLGDYPHALEDFNQAIKLNADIPDYYYNRGVTLRNLGNYEQALKDYSRAIKLNPRYSKAYSNRANVFKRLGNYPQAIIDYSIAIDLDPQSSVIYYNRGVAYHESGDYQQAITDYSKAISLNSQYADAYFNRGIAYKDMGDCGLAIKDLEEVVKLTPRDAIAYYNLGLCYTQLGDIGLSMSYYKKAYGLGSKEAQANLRKNGRF